MFIPGKIIHHRIRPNPDSTQGIINDPSARLAINDSKGVSIWNASTGISYVPSEWPKIILGRYWLGCFQFAFVPYQFTDQMTRISIRPEVEYDQE